MVNSVWQQLVDIVTLQFMSSFWWWAWWGFVVIVACVAIGWFFQALRPYAGVVVAIVVAGLAGYRQAMADAAAKKAEQAKRAREAARLR
jgi:hypothetical protein